ncbi:MAG TPA: carboxypeptidase regulatory-like domain-containing protein, partial [Pyrinomonadaceae bacterium]|nr:carboxypeptidase regulatory-like domain-containing protein [Pyrinomonadaceae bacterium]
TLLLFIPVLLTATPVPQTPAELPLYRSTGQEATLVGAIMVTGATPKPMTIDMFADPVCVQLNTKPQMKPFTTNDSGLLNAFVYVTGEPLKTYRFDLPNTAVDLERVKCQFTPRVLGVRVGQSVRFINSDPTVHNTHPTPSRNVEWNASQAVGAEPLVKTFAREEALIPVKCNQHPWEKAYVGVMDHPFFAVSNELGNYEISGLPPGTYKLVAWHEAFTEQQMEITLVAGESRRIDFTFDVDKNLKTAWPHWEKR